MTSQNVVVCTLEFLDAKRVKYHDNRHLGTDFDGELDTDPLRAATEDWLTRSLRERHEVCTGDGLKILGQHLYAKAFREKIDETFRQTFKDFEKSVRGNQPGALRLEIVFHQAAEKLAALPWEFLYYPYAKGGGTFLSGEKHTLVLTRVVADLGAKMGTPLERPLRVLLAVCAPRGMASGTVGGVKGLLVREEENGRLHLDFLEDPTYLQLQAAVQRKQDPPDIVHFIGHGTPGALIMRREPERVAAAVADHDIAQSRGDAARPVQQHEEIETSKVEALFQTYKPPLVFIQACYGASFFGRDVLYSTALEIARAEVPAVIAMQYDIGAEEADLFATTFYAQLIAGATIGEAVWAGRKELAIREGSAWEHRDFGTPVVYIEKDSEVVAPATGQQPQKEERAALTCPRCGFGIRYWTCARCKLRLKCACAKENPGCDCEAELEYPINGFCASCEHESSQPAWDEQGGQPSVAATAEQTRELRAVPDSYEAT